MSIVLSLLFYLALTVFTSVFMRTAQKTDNKIWMIFPIVALVLTAGLRAKTVGVDTNSNIRLFIDCYYNNYRFITKEHLYYYIAVGLMHIWKNTSFVLTVYALVIYSLIFLRLWDFRKTANLGIASALFVLFYFGGSMNGMRQYIAIAILFFGTRYLPPKKYLLFLAFLFLAFSFHSSAIIGALFLLLYIGPKRVYKLWEFIIVVGTALAVIPVSIYYVRTYSGYLDTFRVNIGIMEIVRLATLVVPFLFCRRAFCSCERQPVRECRDVDLSSVQLVFVISCIGMILALASFVVDYASRIGYYFRIYEIVFFGMIFESEDIGKQLKLFLGTVLLLLGIYYLYAYHGIVPYHTIFWT